MLQLKNGINNNEAFKIAIARRSNDYGFDPSDLRRRRSLSSFFAEDITPASPFRLGDILFSGNYAEYIRNIKYFINIDNLNLQSLENDVNIFIKSNLYNIASIKKEALALNAVTVEREIQINQEYDYVHFNNFSRESDMSLPLTDNRWLLDYKTEATFDNNQHAMVIDGAGMLLPIIDRVEVPISDVQIINEETDIGSSIAPLISTDPRYLILPNKVFKHVIIKVEHDDTDFTYSHTDAYLTLSFELGGGLQTLNHLRVIPSSSSSMIVNRIAYINSDNEQLDIDTLSVSADFAFHFFFEPITAKKIILELIQYAPVTKLGRNNVDLANKELNKLLEGLGWSYRFDTTEEYLEGSVYDFSIESISLGLNTYLNSGVFRSKDIVIENLASILVSDDVDLVDIANETDFVNLTKLPASNAYTEYYVGLEVRNSANTRILTDLLPIPKFNLLTPFADLPVVEFLPILGGIARVGLLPDLLWSASKNRILSAATTTDPQMLLTTETAHGLSVGDIVLIDGPYDNSLIGSHEVLSVPSTVTFTLVNTNTHTEIDENTTPRAYLLSTVGTSPFEVYRDGELLAIGTDYELNFGDVSTWYQDFPTPDALQLILNDPRSGKLRIKFKVPDYESAYWIKYKPYDGQYLGKTKHIKLFNGSLVVDKAFRKNTATINLMSIIRSNISSPFITPVLKSYSFKAKRY